MMKNNSFVAFILTHGRANNVLTYNTLRKQGYTGRIVLVLDNEDEQAPLYIEKYGKRDIYIFDKAAVAETFDEAVRGDRRTIVYARNACFDIASELGYRYFIELDDDYDRFSWRFDHRLFYLSNQPVIGNLDSVFDIMLDYFKSIPAKSIAFSQGGDFIGGKDNPDSLSIRMKRKSMNSFFCDTERRFTFVGRINEDVNTYTRQGSVGDIFFQLNHVMLNQMQTQANVGGMSDVYLDTGTFLKSFFTVMYHPSSVKIYLIGNEHSANAKRIHHRILWRYTVPCILRETFKKSNPSKQQ